MKNKKRRMEIFSFYDSTGIEKHLEKMAEKGWMLEKISGMYWAYHRIEPANIKFTVTYFSKSSEFDPAPTDDEQTFYEFCEYTGWKLACSRAHMHIFYNENENPTPIETDPETHVETVHRTVRKSFLPAYITLLIISALMMYLFIGRLFYDPIGLIADSTSLFTVFSWSLLFILCITELIRYYIWYFSAKKAAQRGEFTPTKSHKRFQLFVLTVILIGFFYWLVSFFVVGSHFMRIIGVIMLIYMAVLFLSVNGIKILLKKKKASRRINRTLTWVSSFVLSFVMMFIIGLGVMNAQRMGMIDTDVLFSGNMVSQYMKRPPVLLEDLYDVSEDDYICETTGDESLLLAKFTSRQYSNVETQEFPGIEYTVISVKAPFLYDISKNSLIPADTGDSYKAADSSPWLAKEAYVQTASDRKMNKYILVYDDCFVEFFISDTPSNRQMETVGQNFLSS